MQKSLIRVGLVLSSLLFVFMLAEISFRIFMEEYSIKNYLVEKKTLLHSSYPTTFDRELGWIPRPGFAGTENYWRKTVTIGSDGIRSNGETNTEPLPHTHSGPILAVGDSYTFGDQVSDDETWPARLETLIHTPVLNGGVFGYGLDQAFLRAKQLITKYRPKLLIVSFIPDDIQRCNFSARASAKKPFFEFNGEDLQLKTDHISPPTSIGEVKGLRRIIGYSYFIHSLFNRLAPVFWYEGRWNSEVAHHQGEEVACQLVRKMEEWVNDGDIDQLMILVQYTRFPTQEEYQQIQQVLSCLKDPQTLVLDLRESFESLKKSDPARYRKLFTAHMTPTGNFFVAETIQKFLAKAENKKASLLKNP